MESSKYFGTPLYTAAEVQLLEAAQAVFIFQQLLNFPCYYLRGLRHLCGGDGDRAKFPCSISWMTRKGLPRVCTTVLWAAGWLLMLRVFLKDLRLVHYLLAPGAAHPHEPPAGPFSSADVLAGLFALKMFCTGLVVVVFYPIQEDLSMGSNDAIHCYGAMLYVADHVIVNEFVLGVRLAESYWAAALIGCIAVTGVFQALRADDNRLALRMYKSAERLKWNGSTRWSGAAMAGGGVRGVLPSVKYASFIFALDFGFMFFENLLFLIFLFGMTSNLPRADAAV